MEGNSPCRMCFCAVSVRVSEVLSTYHSSPFPVLFVSILLCEAEAEKAVSVMGEGEYPLTCHSELFDERVSECFWLFRCSSCVSSISFG